MARGKLRSKEKSHGLTIVVAALVGSIVGVGPFGFKKVYAAEPNQLSASQTPSATIQAVPIEINASAPKPEPDPYALPSHAPEFLVKMRSELEKAYVEHRSLASQMLNFLAVSNFDVRSPSPGQGQSAIATYGDLLRKLDTLNSKIEASEAEFIHEKQVFLAHGVSPLVQTAATQVGETSTVQLVHDK